MTAGDMAYFAARKLFAENIYGEGCIDYLILCTQSPDYPLPTTACILQNRLGLPKTCGAVDFNLGCSGYVYGLGLAKGLIESGQAKNVLLLTSETYSRYIHPKDNATKPLFGDAASATLIAGIEAEYPGIYGLVYGTDGDGADKLIVPAGGMKHRYSETDIETFTDDYGSIRTNYNLYMNGAEIMNFALDVVPGLVDDVLAGASLTKQDVDYYVFHQANKMVLSYLREKCGLLGMPYWDNAEEYGNTVSSSIPVALCDMMGENRTENLKRVVLAGFGVGLSWAGCVVDISGCNA